MYTAASVITHRHIRLIIALLLPLMVLRAMLPTGFMPVTENGELRIVMCSVGLSTGSTAADADQKLPSNAGDCVFAHAAVDAPPLAALQIIAVSDSYLAAASVHAASIRIATILRTQSSRGPPPISL
jgi:hypothetical protein